MSPENATVLLLICPQLFELSRTEAGLRALGGWVGSCSRAVCVDPRPFVWRVQAGPLTILDSAETFGTWRS